MYVRRNDSAGGDGPGGKPVGGEFSARWAAIWEYIAEDKWEDGKARQTSTLQLFTDRGACKVCLKDRDQGVNCWVTGRDPFEALDALESVLRSGTAEWVPDAFKKRR